MNKIHFWKLESIGNDFPLVLSSAVMDAGQDFHQLAIEICDRHRGVGGDGLLVLNPLSRTKLGLRMFNPDGTEDFCGNGIRCAAHVAQTLNLTEKKFEIEHLGRSVPIEIEGGYIKSIIGLASYDPTRVPLRSGESERFEKPIFWKDSEQIIGSALSTGSTHVVIPVTSIPGDDEFERLGPLIENFDLYPERTSVIWREQVSRDSIKLRIWERGVGETLGCGTGSSAAAMDLLRQENRGGTIEVVNPGGQVTVSAERWDAPITVEGTARLVYEGDYRSN